MDGRRIGLAFVGLGVAFLLGGLASLVVALFVARGGTQLFLLCVAVPLLGSGLRLVRLGRFGLQSPP